MKNYTNLLEEAELITVEFICLAKNWIWITCWNQVIEFQIKGFLFASYSSTHS